MMQFIAEAAKAARRDAGFSHAHIAAARGVRESTVVRFESGRMQRVNIDEMLTAYALVTGLAAIVFWERALDAWREVLAADESTNHDGSSNDGAASARRPDERRRTAKRA